MPESSYHMSQLRLQTKQTNPRANKESTLYISPIKKVKQAVATKTQSESTFFYRYGWWWVIRLNNAIIWYKEWLRYVELKGLKSTKKVCSLFKWWSRLELCGRHSTAVERVQWRASISSTREQRKISKRCITYYILFLWFLHLISSDFSQTVTTKTKLILIPIPCPRPYMESMKIQKVFHTTELSFAFARSGRQTVDESSMPIHNQSGLDHGASQPLLISATISATRELYLMLSIHWANVSRYIILE